MHSLAGKKCAWIFNKHVLHNDAQMKLLALGRPMMKKFSSDAPSQQWKLTIITLKITTCNVTKIYMKLAVIRFYDRKFLSERDILFHTSSKENKYVE